MKIEDRRPGNRAMIAGNMHHGDVFEYESYIYMRIRGRNGRVDVFIDGVTEAETNFITAVNQKSGTVRPIGINEPVQQVRGRCVIERNV